MKIGKNIVSERREEDEMERKKEEEAKTLEELKKIQQEEENAKKREWEQRNVFTKIEENLQNPGVTQPTQPALVINSNPEIHVSENNKPPEPQSMEINQTFKMVDTVDEDNDPLKKRQAVLPKLNESTQEAMNRIEAEVKVKSQEEEEQRTKAQKIWENIDKDEVIKKQVEHVKQLYETIPTRKNELFKYPVNWEVIEKNNVLEKKLRPWVAKRIKDYLGSEEETVINLIVTKVKKKCPPQEIEDKMETFLEKDAEEFVVKMWKLLVFEQLKIENNLVPQNQ